MRIVIVADNASRQFGGEAFIPLNYFRLLLVRGEDVRLVVHERNKLELIQQFPDHLDRLYFVKDTAMHKALFWFGSHLPRRLAEATTGLIIHLSTQLHQRRVVRALVKTHGVEVVHAPIPVSPKTPSLMWGLGAAVVIGPLNGGMDYPKAFRRDRSVASRLSLISARWLANLVNMLLPGKRRAAVVLVANQRTRSALPRRTAGCIIDLVENGVDFSIWRQRLTRNYTSDAVRFVFMGRLIDWKALDIVLEALQRLHGQLPVSLEVIGDGPMRQDWQALVDRLKLSSVVKFSGWLPQDQCALRLEEADALVLPSLFECGGAVVLEAMAMALPVIATAWGGPCDYLDASCGILVEPASREALVCGFADGMTQLATTAQMRKKLGDAGLARAREHFDWDRKIDQIVKIYHIAIDGRIRLGGA